MNSEIGKIKSLALRDFLTYDELRYIPGTNLNIIIGPNGTGKSTIVAGIILGCGGKPALLSRSKDISDFVKNGKTKAHIEIELQKDDDTSIVLHRSFDKTGKQSFTINGEKVSEKSYIERVRLFNIQVDNLCMFLPQDRVQDFTKLNSQELLHNTQISVCSPEINEAFELLKKKREQQKNSAKANSDIQTQLDDQVNRNEQLQTMIENSRTKEKLIEQREMHLKKKAWLEFDDLKAKFDEADADVKKLEETIKNKIKALEPLEKKQKEVAGKKNSLKNAISASNTNTQQIQKQIDRMMDSIKNINSEIRESRQKVKNLFESARNHAKDVKDLELKIELDKSEHEQAQQSLQEEGNENLIREFDQKMAHHKTEIEKSLKKVHAITAQMDSQVVPAIESSKRKIGFMNDAFKQRIAKLRNHFEDAYKAFLWLEGNRHTFQGHIFNPVILEITVSESRYAKYLENTIANRDLQMFLCTEKSDVAKLAKKFRNEMGLQVNIGHVEDAEQLNFQSPREIDEFNREFGIYAYLIDMLDGPAPVLNYLCKHYRLHNVIVGKDQIEQHASKLPDDIRVFFSTNSRFSVTISRYTGNKSVLSNNIYPRNLLDVSTDHEALQQEQQILNTYMQRAETLKAQRSHFQQQIEGIQKQFDVVRAQKNEILNKVRRVKQMADKIRTREVELEALKKRKVDVHELRQKQKNENDKLVKKLVAATVNAGKALEDYNKSMINRELAKKKLKIFDDSTGNVDQTIEEIKRDVFRIQDTVNRARIVYQNLKHRMNIAMKDALQMTDNIPPTADKFPFKSKFAKLPNTIEELQDKIDEMQGRIECIRGVDPKIVEEFEQRKDTIEQLRNDLSQQQKRADALESQMQQLHDTWYPEILRVVNSINQNFSNFFAKMGFVGEVELIRKAERDYNDYGIQIRVQYRDNEKLQALNRHVQSGGERAVAIAVYTLSLQHLTMVPFRCVDEINQGMDPKNERKIFQMLVDITCQEGQSQYFFVTPKLLPDLPYSDYMTITVVHNGKSIEDPYVFEKDEGEESTMMNSAMEVDDDDDDDDDE